MKKDIFTPIQIDSNQSMREPGSESDPESDKRDLSKIDNIEFDDIDHSDYPDFCDAYISSADYDGVPMTDDELAELNENEGEFVHEKLFDYLY
jgi:hypothetical protein